MRHAILTVVLAGSVGARHGPRARADRYQDRNEGGRYSAEAQGIPPGYLPAPGDVPRVVRRPAARPPAARHELPGRGARRAPRPRRPRRLRRRSP